MLKKFILSLSSAILLALPWLVGWGGCSLFVAFIPLFILQSQQPRRFGLWAALTFSVWIILSTWWVAYATLITTVAIPLVGLFFSLLPFIIFHYIQKREPGALAWVIFVTIWIAFEALYTYQDISFPWLNLGNGFMQMPWAVQWYEYTGTFGGTLWVLVANILGFKLCQKFSKTTAAVLAAWILVPITGSVIIYTTYHETPDPVKVCVVQPNIDPYSEKFSGMTQNQQADRLLGLASEAPEDVEFIVTPETALEDDFDLADIAQNYRVRQIRAFLAANHPRATMILGASTYRDKEGITHAESWNDRNQYNSALWIDSSARVEAYHKSKLVIGAEMIPYPRLFKFLQLDLGGMSGNRQKQAERTGYDQVGVAICYESIYGSYYTQYVDHGARAMFIITNDGWWHDTRGHHHHLNMARLRAIETRRSIARSANTGISALINQRGDVVQRMDWCEEGTINGTINLNTAQTFYVQHKDYIVSLSVYTLALSLLYFVGQRFRRKR